MSLVLKYDNKKILLEGQRIKVGRAQGKNDIVISDQQVSSEHLVINNGVLVDARSTNGTFINDSADPVAKGEEYVLKEGDVVTIATYKLHIERDDGSANAAPAAAADEAAAKAQADLVATSKTPLRAWAQHRLARSSATSATVRSSAFAAANAAALAAAAAREHAAATAAGAGAGASSNSGKREDDDDDDAAAAAAAIDDVVVKKPAEDGAEDGGTDPTQRAAAAEQPAIPAVIDDEQLAEMTAEQLRDAYRVRATEVRVLTSKLKHKATATRVMFHRNVHSKLEELRPSAAAAPQNRLSREDKDELDSLKFQVLYGESKKDKQITALERQLADARANGTGAAKGPSAAALAAAVEDKEAAFAEAKATLNATAAAAKQAQASAEKRTVDLEERLRAVEEKRKQLETLRLELQQEKERLESQVASQENDLGHAKQQLAAVRDENAELKDSFDTHTAQIKKLNAQLSEAKADKLKAEKETSKYRMDYKTIEAERAKLQTEAATLRTQLEKANNLGLPVRSADWKSSAAAAAAAAAAPAVDLSGVTSGLESVERKLDQLIGASGSASVKLRTELRPDISMILSRTTQILTILIILTGLLILFAVSQ